jgi:hypothetical protein
MLVFTSSKRSLLGVLAVLITSWLTACANPPAGTGAQATAAQPNLEFVDIDNFDRSLNASLVAKLAQVDIAVVNNVTATAIPPRLQAWLHAVESGGGTVKVIPPQSSVTAKNPMLLLSLVSGIWNTIKATKAFNAHELHKPAAQYDAQIVLKISEQGDRLIDKILLTQRAPKP